jgi:hypothetical protein
MIMFYAGSATMDSRPEIVLKEEQQSGVMFTFFDIYEKRNITIDRIKELKKRRVKGLKNESRP